MAVARGHGAVALPDCSAGWPRGGSWSCVVERNASEEDPQPGYLAVTRYRQGQVTDLSRQKFELKTQLNEKF